MGAGSVCTARQNAALDAARFGTIRLYDDFSLKTNQVIERMGLLKNNLILREATEADAAVILDIQKRVVAELEYLITAPEEFNKTVEEQQEWIHKVIQNERETIVAAEADGAVVGWIAFQTSPRSRLAHTGSIGMMIEPSFRNRGIGKALIMYILDWAAENPFIEKVCLGVLSTNERAIRLYEGLGFVEEGRKVKDIKFSEDRYADDVLMYKFV